MPSSVANDWERQAKQWLVEETQQDLLESIRILADVVRRYESDDVIYRHMCIVDREAAEAFDGFELTSGGSWKEAAGIDCVDCVINILDAAGELIAMPRRGQSNEAETFQRSRSRMHQQHLVGT